MSGETESTHEQFTRLWTTAQPAVASFLDTLLPDFRDAQDALQNVAVACLRKFDEYNSQRPFVAWAMGMARLEALRARRSHARGRLVFDDELIGRIAAASEHIQPEFERRSAALRECLKGIPVRAAQMLELRYGESLKPADIAGRLQMAALAVRVALSRTREALRECIERRLRSREARS